MAIDLLQLLSDLIAIPSVNPMGLEVTGPEYFEQEVGDYLERFLNKLDVRVFRQPVAPRRDNIIARLDGSVPLEDGGPLVMFDVHQDTVPTGGMTINPWRTDLRDGRVYGRGACDVKGGMAALLIALARLVEQRPANMPTVVLSCSVNEECGFTGVRALAEMWAMEDAQSIVPRRPDACIVVEPTELNVVAAHKGVVRWRCETRGRSGHSSQPTPDQNAIYKMAHLLHGLQNYVDDVLPHADRHPRCGGPTLSVGTIVGGISVNTVPESCRIQIDRRLVPGEQPRVAQQQVIEYLARETHVEAVHHEPFLEATGLADDSNAALAARVQEVIRDHNATADVIGVPYGTNASVISNAGVPTVVFGPGSIAQAHTADEWIDLAEAERASNVFYELARTAVPAI